ncbi:Rad17 cell cycle checkpoint protein-domain-containing protein [Syncephalis plumigaleata]|nr:Rad17 cell cycle checkpoint protein-domain-containing protein [Syncephalis plumigaleata]
MEETTTELLAGVKRKSRSTSTRSAMNLSALQATFKSTDNSDTTTVSESESAGSALWTDQYEPTTMSELAMHKRKIASVREWLEKAYNPTTNQSASKLLVLTGPCGSGKTATVRVLAQALSITVNEWVTPISSTSVQQQQQQSSSSLSSLSQLDTSSEYTSINQRFIEFMASAERYTPLAMMNPVDLLQPTSRRASSTRTLLLIEDLPYLGHESSLPQFERAMLQFLAGMSNVPAIIILSDTLDRQMADEVIESHVRSRASWSAHNALPISITSSPRCQTIRFNPVAPTFMTKALHRIIHQACPYILKYGATVSQLLASIVTSAHGDIRVAVNTLQLQVGNQLVAQHLLLMKVNELHTTDETLSYFHGLGKILYNKRISSHALRNTSPMDKTDMHPANANATAVNANDGNGRLETYDAAMDPEQIISSAGFDREQFLLYLHQNYLLFADDIETCSSVMTWQSISDNMLGQWTTRGQMLPYALITSLRGYMWETRDKKATSGFRPLYKPDLWDVRRAQQKYIDGLSCTATGINMNKLAARDRANNEFNLDVLPYLRQRNRAVFRNEKTGQKTYGEETYWVHPIAAKTLNPNLLDFMASSSIFRKMRPTSTVLSSTGEVHGDEFSAQEMEPGMACHQVALSNDLSSKECDNDLHSRREDEQQRQQQQHTGLATNEVIDVNDPIDNVDFL